MKIKLWRKISVYIATFLVVAMMCTTVFGADLTISSDGVTYGDIGNGVMGYTVNFTSSAALTGGDNTITVYNVNAALATSDPNEVLRPTPPVGATPGPLYGDGTGLYQGQTPTPMMYIDQIPMSSTSPGGTTSGTIKFAGEATGLYAIRIGGHGVDKVGVSLFNAMLPPVPDTLVEGNVNVSAGTMTITLPKLEGSATAYEVYYAVDEDPDTSTAEKATVTVDPTTGATGEAEIDVSEIGTDMPKDVHLLIVAVNGRVGSRTEAAAAYAHEVDNAPPEAPGFGTAAGTGNFRIIYNDGSDSYYADDNDSGTVTVGYDVEFENDAAADIEYTYKTWNATNSAFENELTLPASLAGTDEQIVKYQIIATRTKDNGLDASTEIIVIIDMEYPADPTVSGNGEVSSAYSPVITLVDGVSYKVKWTVVTTTGSTANDTTDSDADFKDAEFADADGTLDNVPTVGDGDVRTVKLEVKAIRDLNGKPSDVTEINYTLNANAPAIPTGIVLSANPNTAVYNGYEDIGEGNTKAIKVIYGAQSNVTWTTANLKGGESGFYKFADYDAAAAITVSSNETALNALTSIDSGDALDNGAYYRFAAATDTFTTTVGDIYYVVVDEDPAPSANVTITGTAKSGGTADVDYEGNVTVSWTEDATLIPKTEVAKYEYELTTATKDTDDISGSVTSGATLTAPTGETPFAYVITVTGTSKNGETATESTRTINVYKTSGPTFDTTTANATGFYLYDYDLEEGYTSLDTADNNTGVYSNLLLGTNKATYARIKVTLQGAANGTSVLYYDANGDNAYDMDDNDVLLFWSDARQCYDGLVPNATGLAWSAIQDKIKLLDDGTDLPEIIYGDPFDEEEIGYGDGEYAGSDFLAAFDMSNSIVNDGDDLQMRIYRILAADAMGINDVDGSCFLAIFDASNALAGQAVIPVDAF